MGYSGQPDDPNAVPQFTPPVNPATPIHHGILGKILGGLQSAGSAIAGGANAVGNVMNQNPDAVTSLISPSDLQHARSASFLALGNSLLNPTLDARGFKQSFLGSAASGLQAGQQASQGAIGGALQAGQYAAGIAQQQRLVQGRQLAAQQFAIQPGDTPQQQLTKLTQHSQFLTNIGDDKGATAIDAAAAAMNHERGIYATGAGAANHFEVKDNGRVSYLFNPETGESKNFDGSPMTDHADHAHLDANAHADTRIVLEQKGQDMAQRNHDDRSDQFAATKFYTDTADLRKENMQANQFLTLADRARNNPEAYKSLIINYMGALDPKAQVRSKMLEYASKIDPSIGGQWDTLRDRIASGKFPANQLQGMIDNVRATHATVQKQYETKYNAAVAQRGGVKNYIPTSTSEFTLAGDAPPVAGAPAVAGGAPANPFR